MNAKINNFINLGIGNAGDGGESLPVYGVWWDPHGSIYIFEVNDINNPRDEINKLSIQETVEFKRLLYYGLYEDDLTYLYQKGEITNDLHNPRIFIENTTGNDYTISDDIFDNNNYEDFSGEHDDILDFVGINNGFVIVYYNNEGECAAGIVHDFSDYTGIIGAMFKL